ncbi:uncharacterized protein [Nicotiana tomentosiformis]|uniref:uncharacterized protein n=1 Tax=Nicotiana tomentosiformis TaxID=4098 RepID=UPI00388C5F57
MINKGCICYLVWVTDTDAEVPTIESVLVVNEFLEVFPDELPGIPPDREIDFGIDMMPSMQPISFPLYKMAPVELNELKEQLKDLEGIKVDPQKIAAVKNWTRPITPMYIRSLLGLAGEGGVVVQNRAESSLVVEVKEKQYDDPLLVQLKEGIQKNKTMAFYLGMDDGTLRYQERLCVPNIDGLWEIIMTEADTSSYHASIQMAPFEDLYGKRCRSPIEWFKIGEAELIGIDLMHQAMERVKIIKERLKTAKSRQKSYLDVRRRDLEFQEDDWVFLKVPPIKGIMRFGKKEKLSPRHELPPEMSLVHPVFHVSILKKVIRYPLLIVPVETIEVNEELTYE